MYYIYALKCEELVLYVGQTVDMRKRFNSHKKRDNACSSSDIPADMDFYIDLLEIVDTKVEAIQREQFFYDTLKPFYNKNRPGQTKEEYNKSRTKKKKEYNAINREKRVAYSKNYYYTVLRK